MNSIRKEIENRGIINLLHFTHWRNLKGIYTLKKIISRKKLLEERLIDREDILFKHNDNFRMEGEQYINLSITHINRNLFKAFRSRSQNNASINWCVIKLDKQLLFDTSLKCLFSVTNAASATAKKYGIGTDLIYFQNMFLNEINITNTSSEDSDDGYDEETVLSYAADDDFVKSELVNYADKGETGWEGVLKDVIKYRTMINDKETMKFLSANENFLNELSSIVQNLSNR